MKKNLTVLLIFCINLFVFSQSKLSLNFSGGSLAIKKDFGVNYDFGIGYKLSNKIQLNAETLFSYLKKNEYDLKYDLQKYSINVNYNFFPESKFCISSISGFSYFNFDKKLNLTKRSGLGLDLGLYLGFNQDQDFSYGLKIINSYNSISNGGIIQSNLVFKYRL